MPSSKGSSQSRDQTQVSPIVGGVVLELPKSLLPGSWLGEEDAEADRTDKASLTLKLGGLALHLCSPLH